MLTGTDLPKETGREYCLSSLEGQLNLFGALEMYWMCFNMRSLGSLRHDSGLLYFLDQTGGKNHFIR